MPEDQGTPGTDVINIAVAIRIENQTALGAIDENGFGPPGIKFTARLNNSSEVDKFMGMESFHLKNS